jgi:hypothetical protein
MGVSLNVIMPVIRFKRDSQKIPLEHPLKPTSSDKWDCVNCANVDFAGVAWEEER